ncbi:hypothetical protein LRR80_06754 [Streptomyces sp. RO-S4]|nr:hypothetical protein [Streptomyces sp. RO-S4]
MLRLLLVRVVGGRVGLALLPSAGEPPCPGADPAPPARTRGLGDVGAPYGGALAGAAEGVVVGVEVGVGMDVGLDVEVGAGGGAVAVAPVAGVAGGPAGRSGGRGSGRGGGGLVPGRVVHGVGVQGGRVSLAGVRLVGRAGPRHPPSLGHPGHVPVRRDPHGARCRGRAATPLGLGRAALLRHQRNGSGPGGGAAVGARGGGPVRGTVGVVGAAVRPGFPRAAREAARTVPGTRRPHGAAPGRGPPIGDCVRTVLRVRRARPRHPYVPLAVRGGGRPRRRALRRGKPQRGLADAQQRARGEPHRAGAHGTAVQGRAVGGAEVGDRDAAVRADRHRAVQPGDVRVVERHVGVGRAAYADLPAVQQMHPARVGSGDDMQPGRGGVQLGMRLGLARGAHRQHRAVDQRGLAQRAALGVQALVTGVEHGRARRAGGAVPAGDRRGQRGGDRGECRARGRRDQHVAAHGPLPDGGGGAQRVYDGQPDLHRRQRSLLRGRPRHGGRSRPAVPLRGLPPPPHAHVRPVLPASSHLSPTARPPPGIK